MSESPGRHEGHEARLDGVDAEAGAGNLPLAPQMGSPDTGLGPAPTSLERAVMLLWAKAGLSIVGALVPLLERNDLRKQFEDGSSATPSQIDTAMNFTIAGSLFLGVIGAGLWSLAAFYARGGASWARALATLLAALGMGGTLLTLTQEATVLSRVLSLVSTVVSVVLLMLLWHRESSAYFRASRF